MQRPGQGRRPSPHPPPTEGREERRDSASPGPHGPRPRGQDSPGRAEKPRPNPTPAWSPGGREGSCRGRAMDGPPHPRQRCQVDSDTQHPQSRPRGFSAHPPTRCQGRAPPGSPPGPRPSPISANPPRSTRVTSFKPSQPWNLLGAERPNVIAQGASACLFPTPRRPLCPSGLDWTLAAEWESGWAARP